MEGLYYARFNQVKIMSEKKPKVSEKQRRIDYMYKLMLDLYQSHIKKRMV